jgi:hypothetical protein
MTEDDLRDLMELGDTINDGSYPLFIDRKLDEGTRRQKASMIFDAVSRLLDERSKVTDALNYVNLYRNAANANK